MRDFVLGLTILGSFFLGGFLVQADAEQWIHWPIYFSMLALAALAVTPIRWMHDADGNQRSFTFNSIIPWLDRIPAPVKKSLSIFFAILVGGLLAALAAKLGLPMPTPSG